MLVSREDLRPEDFHVSIQILIGIHITEAIFLRDPCVNQRREHIRRQRIREGFRLIPIENLLHEGTTRLRTHYSRLDLHAGDILLPLACSIGCDGMDRSGLLQLTGMMLHAGDKLIIQEIVKPFQDLHVGIQIKATLRIKGIHPDIIGGERPFACLHCISHELGSRSEVEVLQAP